MSGSPPSLTWESPEKQISEWNGELIRPSLGLALLVALTIRLNSEHRFQTTPLDYLMVFLAVMVPALPEMQIGDIHLSFLTAKLIVLFFSFELLLHVFAQRVTQLGLVALWLLCGIAVRAWL